MISLFLLSFVLLLGRTAFSFVDINDDWLLGGILPYFLLFVVLYSVVACSVTDLKLVAFITALFMVAVNCVPNLKYTFIYGYYDSLPHYGFVQGIMNVGHIPATAFYSIQYGAAPGLHIFLSSLAIVSGGSAVYAFKLFLTLYPSTFPLLLYFVTKRIKAPTLLSKATLISVAVISPVIYPYTGTSAVFFLYVPFLYIGILLIAARNSLPNVRAFLILDTLLALSIVISHDVTTFLLLGFFLSALIVSTVRKVVAGRSLDLFPYTVALGFVIIALSHLLFSSDANFDTFLNLIFNSIQSLFQGSTPLAVSYYQGFYILSLKDQLLVYVAKWGMYTVAVALTVSALVFVRFRMKQNETRKFYNLLVFPLLFPLFVLLLSLFVRAFNDRFFYYFLAFVPFFAGLTFYKTVYSRSHRLNNVFLSLAVLSLILITSFQRYPPQPLFPLITSEYGRYAVVDWRQVNTIYDRSLIAFASGHITNRSIATDNPMRWQIYGLTDIQFQRLLTWDNPVLDESVNAPLVFVSPGTTAHIIASGKDAIRYHEYIDVAVEIDDLLYTNGQSYILQNFTSRNR
jgi:hypothetical protein